MSLALRRSRDAIAVRVRFATIAAASGGLRVLAKEPLEFLRHQVRQLFREIMSARQRSVRARSPARSRQSPSGSKHLPITPCSPHSASIGHGDSPAVVFVVVPDVDRRGGAIIFATRMDRRRIAKAAQIFSERFGSEMLQVGRPPSHPVGVRDRRRSSAPGSGAGWIRKNQCQYARAKASVVLAIHLARRRDVERREAQHPFGVIEREPVRDARAAIMRADMEAARSPSAVMTSAMSCAIARFE